MQINHDFNLNNKGFSNSEESLLLPRHRWYSYKEGFSPSLVQYALNSFDFDKKKDVIFDPFNGSGTVTLFSSLLGVNCIGHEVNPFSSFISKTKQKVFSKKDFEKFGFIKDSLCKTIKRGNSKSSLLKFSTFSKTKGKEKWLFNSPVLNSFDAGLQFLEEKKSDSNIADILKLALINSAMENCNAKKDGKCLRYKPDWSILNYDKASFLSSLESSLEVYFDDLANSEIITKSTILNGDTLKLSHKNNFEFKLCITSPPYLNSFDYTDVYRPELFLGGFLKDQDGFNKLKNSTLRSHITFDSKKFVSKSFGAIYDSTMANLKLETHNLWSPKIPMMIQNYFEDLGDLLLKLKTKASPNAQIWMVVANSAYANVEIPTDLILAEIGSKNGWYLKDIGVLRHLNKRGSKYSPDIKTLRESVIIFSKNKF